LIHFYKRQEQESEQEDNNITSENMSILQPLP